MMDRMDEGRLVGFVGLGELFVGRNFFIVVMMCWGFPLNDRVLDNFY